MTFTTRSAEIVNASSTSFVITAKVVPTYQNHSESPPPGQTRAVVPPKGVEYVVLHPSEPHPLTSTPKRYRTLVALTEPPRPPATTASSTGSGRRSGWQSQPTSSTSSRGSTANSSV